MLPRRRCGRGLADAVALSAAQGGPYAQEDSTAGRAGLGKCRKVGRGRPLCLPSGLPCCPAYGGGAPCAVVLLLDRDGTAKALPRGSVRRGETLVGPARLGTSTATASQLSSRKIWPMPAGRAGNAAHSSRSKPMNRAPRSREKESGTNGSATPLGDENGESRPSIPSDPSHKSGGVKASAFLREMWKGTGAASLEGTGGTVGSLLFQRRPRPFDLWILSPADAETAPSIPRSGAARCSSQRKRSRRTGWRSLPRFA